MCIFAFILSVSDENLFFFDYSCAFKLLTVAILTDVPKPVQLLCSVVVLLGKNLNKNHIFFHIKIILSSGNTCACYFVFHGSVA